MLDVTYQRFGLVKNLLLISMPREQKEMSATALRLKGKIRAHNLLLSFRSVLINSLVKMPFESLLEVMLIDFLVCPA